MASAAVGVVVAAAALLASDLLVGLTLRCGVLCWLLGQPPQDLALRWLGVRAAILAPGAPSSASLRVYLSLSLWRPPALCVRLDGVWIAPWLIDTFNAICWYLPGVVASCHVPELLLVLRVRRLLPCVELSAPSGLFVECRATGPAEWDAAEVAEYTQRYKRWRVDRATELLDMRARLRAPRWPDGWRGALAGSAVSALLSRLEVRLARFVWRYGECAPASAPGGPAAAASSAAVLEVVARDVRVRTAAFAGWRACLWMCPQRVLLHTGPAELVLSAPRDSREPLPARAASDRAAQPSAGGARSPRFVLARSEQFAADVGLGRELYVRLAPRGVQLHLGYAQLGLLGGLVSCYGSYGSWWARAYEARKALGGSASGADAERYARAFGAGSKRGAAADAAVRELDARLSADAAILCRWRARGPLWPLPPGAAAATAGGDVDGAAGAEEGLPAKGALSVLQRAQLAAVEAALQQHALLSGFELSVAVAGGIAIELGGCSEHDDPAAGMAAAAAAAAGEPADGGAPGGAGASGGDGSAESRSLPALRGSAESWSLSLRLRLGPSAAAQPLPPAQPQPPAQPLPPAQPQPPWLSLHTALRSVDLVEPCTGRPLVSRVVEDTAQSGDEPLAALTVELCAAGGDGADDGGSDGGGGGERRVRLSVSRCALLLAPAPQTVSLALALSAAAAERSDATQRLSLEADASAAALEAAAAEEAAALRARAARKARAGAAPPAAGAEGDATASAADGAEASGQVAACVLAAFASARSATLEPSGAEARPLPRWSTADAPPQPAPAERGGSLRPSALLLGSARLDVRLDLDSCVCVLPAASGAAVAAGLDSRGAAAGADGRAGAAGAGGGGPLGGGGLGLDDRAALLRLTLAASLRSGARSEEADVRLEASLSTERVGLACAALRDGPRRPAGAQPLVEPFEVALKLRCSEGERSAAPEEGADALRADGAREDGGPSAQEAAASAGALASAPGAEGTSAGGGGDDGEGEGASAPAPEAAAPGAGESDAEATGDAEAEAEAEAEGSGDAEVDAEAEAGAEWGSQALELSVPQEVCLALTRESLELLLCCAHGVLELARRGGPERERAAGGGSEREEEGGTPRHGAHGAAHAPQAEREGPGAAGAAGAPFGEVRQVGRIVDTWRSQGSLMQRLIKRGREGSAGGSGAARAAPALLRLASSVRVTVRGLRLLLLEEQWEVPVLHAALTELSVHARGVRLLGCARRPSAAYGLLCARDEASAEASAVFASSYGNGRLAQLEPILEPYELRLCASKPRGSAQLSVALRADELALANVSPLTVHALASAAQLVSEAAHAAAAAASRARAPALGAAAVDTAGAAAAPGAAAHLPHAPPAPPAGACCADAALPSSAESELANACAGLPLSLGERRPTDGAALPTPGDYAHWREPAQLGEGAGSGQGDGAPSGRAERPAAAGEAAGAAAGGALESTAARAEASGRASHGLFVLRNAILAAVEIEWWPPPHGGAGGDSGAEAAQPMRVGARPGQSIRFGATADALGPFGGAASLWAASGAQSGSSARGGAGVGADGGPARPEGAAGASAGPPDPAASIWGVRTRLRVEGYEPIEGVPLRQIGCHARLLTPARGERAPAAGGAASAEPPSALPGSGGVPVILEVCRLAGGQRLLCVRAPLALRNGCASPLALTSQPAEGARRSDAAAMPAAAGGARKTIQLRAGARVPLPAELALHGGTLLLDVSRCEGAGAWRRARADPSDPSALGVADGLGSLGVQSGAVRGVQAVSVAECVAALAAALASQRRAAAAAEARAARERGMGGAGCDAECAAADLFVSVSAPVVCAPGAALSAGGSAEAAQSACVTVTVSAQPLLSGRESGVVDALVTLRSALALANKLPVTAEFELWPEAGGAERWAGGGGASSASVGARAAGSAGAGDGDAGGEWGRGGACAPPLCGPPSWLHSASSADARGAPRGWPPGARGHRVLVGSGEVCELAPLLAPGCASLVARLRPAGAADHCWSTLVPIRLTPAPAERRRSSGASGTARGHARGGEEGEEGGVASFLADELRLLLRLERLGSARAELPLLLVCHCPLWLANLSGVPLEYQSIPASAGAGGAGLRKRWGAARAGTPTATDRAHAALMRGCEWASPWPAAGGGDGGSSAARGGVGPPALVCAEWSAEPKASAGMLLRVRAAGGLGGPLSFGSSWSAPFSPLALGTDGELALEMPDGSSCVLGVSVRSAPPGYERHAVLVSVCARYSVINTLPRPLCLLPAVFAPSPLAPRADGADGPAHGLGPREADGTQPRADGARALPTGAGASSGGAAALPLGCVRVPAHGRAPALLFPPAGDAPCAIRLRVEPCAPGGQPRGAGTPTNAATPPASGAWGGRVGFASERWAPSPLLPLGALDDHFFRLQPLPHTGAPPEEGEAAAGEERAGEHADVGAPAGDGGGGGLLSRAEERAAARWQQRLDHAPIVRVALMQRGGCIVLLVTDASSSPPFCIENRTRQPLTVRQVDGLDSGRTLAPMEWTSYAWPSPRCTRRVLVSAERAGGAASARAGRYLPVAEYPLEGLADFRPAELPGGAKLYAHTHARGPTRVLTLSDRPGPGAERGLTLHEVPLSVSVRLAGAGLTVLDGSPRELLYGCALGCELAVAVSPHIQRLELRLRAVQLDSLAPSARHPVLLRLDELGAPAPAAGALTPAAERGGAGAGAGGARARAPPPSECAEACFLYLQVVRRDAGFYHLVQLLPPTLKLVLDVAVLEAAIRAVLAGASEPSADGGAGGIGGGGGSGGHSWLEAPRAGGGRSALREALEAEAAELLPPPDAEQAAALSCSSGRMVYVETLHLGRLGANLTAIVEERSQHAAPHAHGGAHAAGGRAAAGALAEAAASGLATNVTRVARRLPVPAVLTRLVHAAIRTVGGLAGALGASLASVSDVHFRFSELVLRNAFTGERQLLSKLSMHYGRQAVTQLGKALGCSDVLGDPLGLLDSVGTGVFEFVREGFGGLVAGDAQQVGGAAKALVRGVIGGATGSTAKITGSLERLVRGATGTRRPADERAERASLLEGVASLGAGLLSPMQGATSLTSFTRGVGSGLVGVVAAPLVGTLMVTTELLRTVHAHVQFELHAGTDVRVRPPRAPLDCAPLRPLAECMLTHLCLRVTGAAHGGPVPTGAQDGEVVCRVLAGGEERLRFGCALADWPDGMRWPRPLLLRLDSASQALTLQLHHVGAAAAGAREHRGGALVGERVLSVAEARELCRDPEMQTGVRGAYRSIRRVWLPLTQPGSLASAYLQLQLALCDGTRDPLPWATECVAAMGGDGAAPRAEPPAAAATASPTAGVARAPPRRVCVGVRSHRVECDGSLLSRHVSYTLSVALGEQRWEVSRRFSDFRRLHEQLGAAFPAPMAGACAQMPGRELLPGLRDKALEASRRMPQLQQYVQWLLLVDETRRSQQLMEFLDVLGQGHAQLWLQSVGTVGGHNAATLAFGGSAGMAQQRSGY